MPGWSLSQGSGTLLAPEPSLPRRETLQRLELENKRLCQQEAADRERQEELQRHLEEANRDRHRLEMQHRYGPRAGGLGGHPRVEDGGGGECCGCEH